MYKFIRKSRKIQTILGITPKNPIYEKIEYDRYISSSKRSLLALQESLSVPGMETLVVGATGAGKTYMINLLFEEFNKIKKEIIDNINESYIAWNIPKESIIRDFMAKEQFPLNIILCPNRIQNLQNEESYDMVALVGNTKDVYAYNLSEINNFSSVYDKSNSLLDYITFLKDTKINLIIDEAHLLVDSSNFRKCIREIQTLIEVVKEKGGSIIYLTGTPDSLLIKPFDKIIEFVDKNYKAPADVIKININGTKKPFVDFVTQELNHTTLPFFRLNSFALTDKITNAFKILDNKVTLTVDSKGKDYYTLTDMDGTVHKIFANELFGNVVMQSQLPRVAKIKGVEKKIDAYGTTSTLEVGTNIKSIAGEEDASLTPCYICQNAENMSINSIIQFFNRVRFHVNEYKILIPGNEQMEVKSLEDIIKGEMYNRDRFIAAYKQMMAAFSTISSCDEDLYNFGCNVVEKFKRADGLKSNLGCLYIDKNTLEVQCDMFSFFNMCYSKYISQLFYNIPMLVSVLKEKLNLDVEVTTIYNVQDSSNDLKAKTREFFDNLEITKEIETQIIENKVTDESIIPYTKGAVYGEIREYISLGCDVKGSIEYATTLTPKKSTQMKNSLRKGILETMKSRENEVLMAYIKKEITLTDIKDEELRNKIYLITMNKKYVQFLKNMYYLMIPTDKAVSMLIKSKSENELDEIYKREAMYMAIDVVSKGNTFAVDIVTFLEAKVIFKHLYKLNDKGNLIQTELTKDLIETLQKELSEELCKTYTANDVIDTLKLMFTFKNKTRKKGTPIKCIKYLKKNRSCFKEGSDFKATALEINKRGRI